MQAVKNVDSIDQSQLLGYLMFYHVPDIKISHDEFKNIFKANSMNEDLLPPKIFEHDAFRRATGTLKGTVSITRGDGSQADARINVDEARNDADQIVRIVGRKIVDKINDDVVYAPVGKFIFDKNIKATTHSVHSIYAQEFDYDKLLQDIVDLYKEWTTYHSKETVRNIINKIVKSTQPVSIIKGAYFIPKSEYDIIKGLQGVIKDLAGYTSQDVPEIEVIPLLDTIEQRVMVEKKASGELMNEIDTIVFELSEMLKEGKEIHPRTIKRITGQFQDLQDKRETYSNLLEVKMTAVSQQLLAAIDKFSKMKAESIIEAEENTEEI